MELHCKKNMKTWKTYALVRTKHKAEINAHISKNPRFLQNVYLF